jgi:predicted dehydrogenase
VDPESGVRRRVGTPDSVQVIAELENGARAIYQFSGVCPAGGGMAIRIYGSAGALAYDLETDRLIGIQSSDVKAGQKDWRSIPIPPHPNKGWNVEADWIESIRSGAPVRFTDFATGVAYMEFTEAVARSAESGAAVELPLSEL